jgi:N-acetylglucosamine-6-phosphate deacetylase
MIVLSGADLVLPDRILSPGTLVIDGDRIAEIRPDAPSTGTHSLFAFHGHYIVPGFIDVHVHGVEGIDSLDGGDPIASMALQLPRYGVTAFCPTTVACTPEALGHVLACVRQARETPGARSARVLPAHLESNFVNPAYRGAQPAACLRSPRAAFEGREGAIRAGRAGASGGARGSRGSRGPSAASGAAGADGDAPTDFDAADILNEIARAAPDVGIVTVAPELDGGLDLIRWLVSRGCHVSLGHSAATYEEAVTAISAGARQATHLFNRMPPLHHREPGLAGAILQADQVAAEVIGDGFHVHPGVVKAVIAAKKSSRVMAITDGTAVSGLQAGARAYLGGRPITAGSEAALLDDGTVAGSVMTMDRVFRILVERVGLSLIDAAMLCATTPARELGLAGFGMLSPGAVADLVVFDAAFSVVQTYVRGQLVYARNTAPSPSV